MMYETWLNTDLKKLNKVVHLKGNLFSQDNKSNLVGVHVFEDGAAVESVGGSITGWILRDDGGSVMVTGETSGNDAWIILPEEAYAVPGPVTITIRHTASSESGAARTSLAVCTAYVYRTVTDTMVDPGYVLPTIEEIIARVQELEGRVTSAMSTISTAVTDAQTARNESVEAKNASVAAKDEAVAAANSLNGATASTVTLQPGSYATVSLNKIDGVFHFSFGIPRGNKGNTGATPNLTIGTVQTLPEGSQATASISGTTENPVLNLGLPRGATGSVDNVSANTIPMSTTDPTTIKEVLDGTVKTTENLKVVTISSLASLPHTVTDASITADMVVVHSVLSNSAAQLCDWIVTAAAGSLTISKAGQNTGIGYGGTDLTLYLARTFGSTSQTSLIRQQVAVPPAGYYYSRTFTENDAESIFASNVTSARIIVYRHGHFISVRLQSFTFSSALTAGQAYTVATLPANARITLMQQGVFLCGGEYYGAVTVSAGTGEIMLQPWDKNVPAGTTLTVLLPIFNLARDNADQDMSGYTLTTP